MKFNKGGIMRFYRGYAIILTILFFYILNCSKSNSPTESTITGPPTIENISPSSGSELFEHILSNNYQYQE